MRLICRILTIVFISAIFLTACTKEDTEDASNQQANKGSLSFGSFIGNLITKEKSDFFKSYKLGIPDCKNEAPLYIRAALKNSKGSWVTGINGGDHFIEIKVNSSGIDTDKDGYPDSWFTQDADQIILPVDHYTLEYFAVLDSKGPDANILYITPRKYEDYGTTAFQNFVNAPLPIDINIREGVKHYVPVEVLCYDQRFAFAYGYLFFNFENTPLINICSNGIICENDDNIPAKFRFKVWSYSEEDNYTDYNLLVNAINYTQTNNGYKVNPLYAGGLCFPLPDSEEEDKYYSEIYVVEDNKEEKLIRKGSFTDTFWKENVEEGQANTEYEFVEGQCGGEDNFDLLAVVSNLDN